MGLLCRRYRWKAGRQRSRSWKRIPPGSGRNAALPPEYWPRLLRARASRLVPAPATVPSPWLGLCRRDGNESVPPRPAGQSSPRDLFLSRQRPGASRRGHPFRGQSGRLRLATVKQERPGLSRGCGRQESLATPLLPASPQTAGCTPHGLPPSRPGLLRLVACSACGIPGPACLRRIRCRGGLIRVPRPAGGHGCREGTDGKCGQYCRNDRFAEKSSTHKRSFNGR